MYITSTNEMTYEDIIKALKQEKRYAEGLLTNCEISFVERELSSGVVEIIVNFNRFNYRSSFAFKIDRRERIFCKDIIYKIRKNFNLCLCNVLNKSYWNENILERSEESEQS